MRTNTRIFAATTLFVAIVVLQACKHPLAIGGKGDIVDITNSGRGCTLEQFQTKDKACTENEVTGDYFVSYKAEPRPGWRFVRWEGCPPTSDFQHCSFGVSAATVDWWDETHPDIELAPSTAVFQPITGETGYLVGPGPVVVGVAYETPTQQGVTGLDGSFQYGEGETVRFMIGSTLLGEVTGQAQVTPFDLAGSAVVTGINITWALEDEPVDSFPYPRVVADEPLTEVNPFQGVINITVLLQSLDEDGNPENGIMIRPGVAALFRGLSLDVSQHWELFRSDSTLHRAIGEANRKHRFSQVHGIVQPAVALDQLYGTLVIDPRTVGVTLLQNGGGDGIPAYTEHFKYDANGNMTRHDDGTPDAFETWQYDTKGYVKRHERDAERYIGHDVETWRYDANSSVIRQQWDYDADGKTEEFKTWQYNADGNVIRHEYGAREHPGYGYHQLELWQYDNKGNVSRQEYDHDGDGLSDVINTWQYDIDGNLTQSTGYFSEFFTQSENRQYNADGNVIKISREGHGDRSGAFRSIDTLQYDTVGNVIKITTEGYTEYNGTYRNVETWKYDANGNVTRRESIEDDNSLEEIETWQYDANGNVTRYECEGGCGLVRYLPADHRIDRLQYHANGNVMLHQIEATSQISGSWRYQYDSNGNLTRYEEHGYDFEDEMTNVIESWRYDTRGNLTRAEEDSNADGKPDNIQTWQYDSNGNLTRTEVDDDGNGMIDGTTTYQYVATGWGHLFSNSNAWRHASSPPLKPRPHPGYLN
jgi:hypothetical protein